MTIVGTLRGALARVRGLFAPADRDAELREELQAHLNMAIAENIRKGEGTIGKLINDDQLYQRAVTIAKSAEQIASE